MQKEHRKHEEYALVDRILNGESDLYRVFVERYSPMVFQLVRRTCRDEDDVANLAQDIFVRAWEKLESFDRRAAFSTWLYSLARNACLDYAKNIRRRTVRLEDLEPDFEERLLSDYQTADRELMELERWQLLEEAVSRLPEEYSVPLLMKYRDGFGYDVISERLGVTVSALKVRVHRARKEMKEWIDTRQ